MFAKGPVVAQFGVEVVVVEAGLTADELLVLVVRAVPGALSADRVRAGDHGRGGGRAAPHGVAFRGLPRASSAWW